MAVKQNNTESNGAPSPISGNTSTTTVTNTLNGGSGLGTKSKKMNPNSDGDGGGNSEQPGCSGTGSSSKQTANANNSILGSNNIANSHLPSKSSNIGEILHLIEIVDPKRKQFECGEMLNVYHILITQLSSVQVPRHSAEDLKRFKEDMLKVEAFFSKANEKRVYMFYLSVVCKLITQNDNETPSCAIAVIFQLFNTKMIFEAVQTLLDHKIANQDIRKTVRLLREWLQMCTFCQNLNLWIIAILNGLRDQKKLALFDEIALENIGQLFPSMIVPVLRPKVTPIVFLMLSSISQTPQVFHKILPRIPRVINCLKQQSNTNEDHGDETKKVLQQLADLTSRLMVRFHGYDELYEPVEQVLRDYRSSNYNSSFKNQNDADGIVNDAVFQHNTNVKVGLVNLGNTCYMNSVLQALAMTKEFSREILLSESKSPLLIKMQQQIALMLYSMRYELTPTRVLNATRPPGFSPGLQQDSSEFLGYLLETLHEQEITHRNKCSSILNVKDCNEKLMKKTVADSARCEGTESVAVVVDKPPRNQPNCETSKTSLSSCSTADDEYQKGTNNTINGLTMSTIERTFTGKLATTYKCLTCGWKSHNVDSFRDLQLSFPEVNDCASNYSVQDLLEYYCSSEKLDGDNQYFCERCKKLSDAERYINVINAPKNLILTLKHFKYDQKYHMRAKLMHKVFHDEKVSIKVCSSETFNEIASVHYDLYAGVVHSGFSMDSGHYYTYAADSSNKWYKFNDNIVTLSKSEELHNLTPPNTPYILFYQMSARSNESVETSASTKVIKVDIPSPLTLEELPRDLRDYVNHDNCSFSEELKMRCLKNAATAALQNRLKSENGVDHSNLGGSRAYREEDDDNQPPPPSGCGGNAMNINVNRFVY